MDDELKEFILASLLETEGRLREQINTLRIQNGTVSLHQEVVGLKEQLDSLEQRISSLEKNASELVNKVSSTAPQNLSMIKLLEKSINPIKIPMAISTKNALDRHNRIIEKLKREFDL